MGDEDECLVDVGALQAYADGPTTFGVYSHYRVWHAKLSYEWDCGERAAVWKAALVVGTYQVEMLSRIAVKHAQANPDCNGASDPDRFGEGPKQLQ